MQAVIQHLLQLGDFSVGCKRMRCFLQDRPACHRQAKLDLLPFVLSITGLFMLLYNSSFPPVANKQKQVHNNRNR